MALGKSNSPTLIVVARHGESLRNAVKRGQLAYPDTMEAREAAKYQDHEIPLTAAGERQAAELGRLLKSQFVGFDKCYDSGYHRAKTTRQIALQEAYGQVEIDRMTIRSELLLRERESGVMRNMTSAEMASIPFMSTWEREYLSNPFQTRFLGGESVADVADRVRAFRDLVFTYHANERILVFCHDLVMKAFRVVLMNEDIEAAIATVKTMKIPNCGVHSYQWNGVGWIINEFDPAAISASSRSTGDFDSSATSDPVASEADGA